MADKLPVKARYAPGSPVDVVALQEFEPTDTISLNLISGFAAGVTSELANNSISTLSDVDISGSPVPTNGEVLAWNSTTNMWEPTLSPGSSAAIWGNITGTLSNQIDLQVALDGKEPANANIQSHISDSSIHFTQAAISITESQISDLQSYALSTHTHAVNDLTDVSNITPVNKNVLIYDGVTNNRYENRLLVEADISDFGTYEPAFTKNTGFNLNLGTTAGTVSEGNHNHSGVYEPANANIQSHIADGTIHFNTLDGLSDVIYTGSPSPINGQVLTWNNVGSYWEPVTPTPGITDHTLLTNIGVNTHAQIDTHIADNTIHFTQANILITESQISNLQAYLLPGDNVSTLTNDAGYLTSFTETDPVFISQKGVANGVATLGTDGKIPSSQIPAIAISETSVVASESAMLALAAQKGDVAVRTDINDSFILKGTDPSLLVDWQKLLTPTDSVLSVNGQTGIVVLTTTDITEGSNLYYTESRVSANTDVAANTTHRTDTTNPHNVTKAQVGLGNADNTSDLSKPISTATQTALDGKENDLLNPSVNGYLLSSTTLGVRSWIDPATVGVTDHGLLTGLGDDDHIQYHNDTRGDVRYYTKTLLDAGQLDNRYYTETEVNSLLANKSDVGHTHVMADIIDSTWISNITGESIKNLSDVNSTMVPTNGQVLTWNNTSSEWEAQNSSGGTPPAICFRHNGSVTQSLTSSFSTINIATNVRTDGSYYTYASNQITILQAGWYKVTYTITFDAAGGWRRGRNFDTQSQLEINSVMVPGSIVYNSGYGSRSNSASANVWINVSANDILRIRSKELSGAAVTEANSCRITVEFYG